MENTITLPKGAIIKIFENENEVKEYLKNYSGYYFEMERKIRDLRKHQMDSLIKKSKNKEDLFNKILEELQEVSNEYCLND